MRDPILGPNGWECDNTTTAIPRVVTDPATGGSDIFAANAAFDTRRIPRLTTLAVQNFAIHAQDVNGVYWGTQESSAGGFGGRVVYATGDITGSPTITGLTNTNTSALYDTDGTTLIGGGLVINVWPLSDGVTLIFAVKTGGEKCYLYKAKYVAGNWNVGNNSPNYDNKAAITRVGDLSGTHTANIIALHQRSLCEATISGSRRLLFGEYNIASGRTAGGSKDQVRVWQSSNDGDTWTALLTFNTAGSHVCDHIHSVVQNPYDSSILFCVGDIANGALIRWDGTSAAPAANSSFATIAATSGWKAYYGVQKYTTGDVLFGPGKAFYLPDVDQVAQGGQYVMEFDYGFTYAFPSVSFSKTDQLPPLIGARNQDGMTIYASLIAATTAEPYFHVWGSADDKTFQRIGKLYQYANTADVPVIATLNNVFFDNAGRVIFSAVSGRGGKLKGGSSMGSTSVVCSLSVAKVGTAESTPVLN